MKAMLYLAWRYLSYNRGKTAILVASLALIMYLPVGLRVLVKQSQAQLTHRAINTPLIVGARGSPLELVLSSLYYESNTPPPVRHAEAERVSASGLAHAIPLNTRFRSGKHPIVGTSLDYFEFRQLRVADGRLFAMLGECVVGAQVAAEAGVEPGGFIVSSPETVFDVAGVYPLRMKVVGVLARSDSPDDRAILVDTRTTWIIEGLGHGHQDLAKPEAVSGVLNRNGDDIVANASVRQYNEITRDNVDSFHFHGDTSGFPLTAIIAWPHDAKSAALLRGRYLGDDEIVQVVAPASVIDELLATVLTVESYVVTAIIVIGMSTLATAALVFLLSLKLRRREIITMFKIGATRGRVAGLVATEILAVLLTGAVIAGGLTLVTARYGSELIRRIIMS